MQYRYPWKAAGFEINLSGRDFAVGDLHGEFNVLERSLGQLSFDYGCDRLFCVGDLIDRGSQSSRVVEFLNFDWFHSIVGNHEWMLLNCHDDKKRRDQFWFPNGGAWWKNVSSEEQLKILDSVETKLFSTITIETKFRKIGMVHALAYPFYNWNKFCQKLEHDQVLQQWALWERDFEPFDQKTIADVDLILCGHTPKNNPHLFGNFINIDTGSGHQASSWLIEPALTIVELTDPLSYHRFANNV